MFSFAKLSHTLHLSFAALSLLAALTVFAAPAIAQEDTANDDKAGALFQQGLAEANAKNYKTAAVLFVAAWSLDPDPSLAFNAGRAYENDGDLANARKYYNIALESDPPEEVRKRCESSIGRLDRAEARLKEQLEAAKPTTAIVSITANIAGGDVIIDGTARGQIPLTTELAPGGYRIEIHQAGHYTYYEDINVKAGEQRALVAELDKKSFLGWTGWTGIGLMVGGIVVGGSGLVFEDEAQAAYDNAQSLRAQRSTVVFEAFREDGESAKSTAQILYGSGIALGAVGAGLLLADLLASDTQEPPPLPQGSRVWVGPTQAGVEIVW